MIQIINGEVTQYNLPKTDILKDRMLRVEEVLLLQSLDQSVTLIILKYLTILLMTVRSLLIGMKEYISRKKS